MTRPWRRRWKVPADSGGGLGSRDRDGLCPWAQGPAPGSGRGPGRARRRRMGCGEGVCRGPRSCQSEQPRGPASLSLQGGPAGENSRPEPRDRLRHFPLARADRAPRPRPSAHLPARPPRHHALTRSDRGAAAGLPPRDRAGHVASQPQEGSAEWIESLRGPFSRSGAGLERAERGALGTGPSLRPRACRAPNPNRGVTRNFVQLDRPQPVISPGCRVSPPLGAGALPRLLPTLFCRLSPPLVFMCLFSPPSLPSSSFPWGSREKGGGDVTQSGCSKREVLLGVCSRGLWKTLCAPHSGRAVLPAWAMLFSIQQECGECGAWGNGSGFISIFMDLC